MTQALNVMYVEYRQRRQGLSKSQIILTFLQPRFLTANKMCSLSWTLNMQQAKQSNQWLLGSPLTVESPKSLSIKWNYEF